LSSGSTTVTGPLSGSYGIDVIIHGVADDVLNDEVKKYDIDVSIDSTTEDLTVTLDTSKTGKYSAVVEEDMNNTQIGAEFNLKSIYMQSGLDSYDNVYSNDPAQTQQPDTSAASETLSVVIKNLGVDFDVSGATLVSGAGASRVWVTNAADIENDLVTITTVEHYSGEVNFDLEYVTTEDDGDTKTSVAQPVSLLVTPEAEGITTVLDAHSDVNEDQLTHMTFTTTTILPDSDEYISAMGIAQNAYDAGGQHYEGVDGADFTIYLGNSTATSLQDAAAISGSGVEIVTESGVQFYKITDPAIYNDLHVLYNADIGGEEVNPAVKHQTTFGFKFDVSDKTTAVQNGSSIDLIDTESGFLNSAEYTFDLSPVTDDITADAHDGDITDTDGDGVNDITVSGHNVTILKTTTINVEIKIDGVDTQNENGTGTNGENGLDGDKSEQIRHIRVEGVPDGIGIIDGKFIGNVAGQPDTGIWLVDLQTPIDMDGSQQTYDLKFQVDGNYINATAPNPTDIKISVINQEYDSSGAPQATAQTDDFTLTFNRDANFSGPISEIPMDILDTNSAITNEDGYSIDTNFAGFKEDIAVKLGDMMHLSINDVQGSNNAELSQNITSDLFSITLEGLQGAAVNAGGLPIIVGTTSGWHLETVAGVDIVTFRGAGTQQDIQDALDLLEITPDQDRNSNNINTDPTDNDNIQFTTTLTTYTQSGVKDAVTTTFSGPVEPVTDLVTVTPDTVTATEDIQSTITLNLDTVDNSFGSDYATIVKSATDTSPVTHLSFTYVGSSDVGHGKFGVTLGGVHFDPGETKDVPVALSGSAIDLTFLADSNEAGKATFTYDIYSHEDNAANVEQSTGNLEINIDPVADGLNASSPEAHGKEDEFIQILDSSGTPISSDLIDNSTNNTTPETLETVIIGDVPPGYLVYTGTAGNQVLAQNLGDNGSGKNDWNVPLSGTTVPDIWVKPPPQLGGVTETFDLITGVQDGGQTVYAHNPIDVEVIAVADPITTNPSPAGGDEGTPIPLNFNTSSLDVDGSEKYEVTLKGLGEGAVFYLGVSELTAADVVYDRVNDTYTIKESVGIDHSTIDDLKVIQNDMHQDIDVEITAYENVTPNDGTTQSATGTFNIDITQQHATTGADTLLYDTKGVDGLTGDDTVIFGTDWDIHNTIDMSALKEIEAFDLTEHGDHSVTLNTTDVESMTDTRNALSIDTDGGDTVILENDSDNVWAKDTTTGDYVDANGAVLTITGAGTVDSSAIDTGTSGNDVLGYFDSTQSIDLGAGNDRLIIFNDLDFQGGQFTKIKNVEVLDLTKQNGDIKLDNLKVNDIQSITNSSAGAVNVLTIESDSGADIVNLSNDWIDAGGGRYEHKDGTNTLDAAIQVNGGATITTSAGVIDGMVAGLRYTTSSGMTGLTAADGSFDYAFGDTVTFNLGNIHIGSVDMDETKDNKIFLQDIAGTDRTDLNDEYVENMAVLLQSLDSDSGENIVITEEMHEAFSEEDFDLATISEEDLVAVIEETGNEAVSEDDAMEHVQDMLVEYGDMDESEFDERTDDEEEGVLVLNDEEENIDMSGLDEEESDEKESKEGEEGDSDDEESDEEGSDDEESDEKESKEGEEGDSDEEGFDDKESDQEGSDDEESDEEESNEVDSQEEESSKEESDEEASEEEESEEVEPGDKEASEEDEQEISEESADVSDDDEAAEDESELEDAVSEPKEESDNLDDILPDKDPEPSAPPESSIEISTESGMSSQDDISAPDPTVTVQVDDQIPVEVG